MQGETSKLEKRKKCNKKVNMPGTQYFFFKKKRKEKKNSTKENTKKNGRNTPKCVINKMQMT